MVKLFCILNAFNRFDKKGMKTSNPLPSRWLSGLSVLWFFLTFSRCVSSLDWFSSYRMQPGCLPCIVTETNRIGFYLYICYNVLLSLQTWIQVGRNPIHVDYTVLCYGDKRPVKWHQKTYLACGRDVTNEPFTTQFKVSTLSQTSPGFHVSAL